jgi:thiopeptide-type bacteriocin biosynthesis protein
MLPLIKLIDKRSEANKSIVKEIISLNYNKQLLVPLNDLMGSYIHMMCNRLFKSKQRMHELVIYTFLLKYYESEIARAKPKQ